MPLLAQLILHDALQPILTLILYLQVLCFLSALLLPIFLIERKKQTPTMQSLGKQRKHYSLVVKRSKEFTAYKTNCQSREEALHVKVRSLITIIQQSTDHSPSDTSDYTGPPYTSPSFNALQLYNTERMFVAHKFDAHILLSNHQHSISTSTSQQLETTTILIHSKDDKITKPPGQKT